MILPNYTGGLFRPGFHFASYRRAECGQGKEC
jgi:hypothetical protein